MVYDPKLTINQIREFKRVANPMNQSYTSKSLKYATRGIESVGRRNSV